jgi:hypothetical protein
MHIVNLICALVRTVLTTIFVILMLIFKMQQTYCFGNGMIGLLDVDAVNKNDGQSKKVFLWILYGFFRPDSQILCQCSPDNIYSFILRSSVYSILYLRVQQFQQLGSHWSLTAAKLNSKTRFYKKVWV